MDTLPLSVDCNENGIDDADDIRSGVDVDADNDGALDNCLGHLDLSWSTKHGQLGPVSSGTRDKTFRVIYDDRHTFRIAYMTAHRSTRVIIAVLRGPGDTLLLRDAMQPEGAHEVVYIPQDRAGRTPQSALQVIRVTLDGQQYLQPVAWR